MNQEIPQKKLNQTCSTQIDLCEDNFFLEILLRKKNDTLFS